MEEMNPTLRGGEESVVAPETNPVSEGGHAGEPAAGNADRQDADRHTFNAAMAAARRKAEKETEERVSKSLDEQIAKMKIPNPMNPGSYFASREELEGYSAALRKADAESRAKKQGRSAEEIMQEDEDKAFLRDLKKREEKSKKASEEKSRQDEFIARDIEDFAEKYPDVDIATLDANRTFRRFVGSRYMKEPLARLYEDYVAVVGETKAAEAVRREDRAERSTGGGSGGSAAPMSAEQRKRLKEWNENFPEMKMTEAEFLKRG